MAMPR